MQPRRPPLASSMLTRGMWIRASLCSMCRGKSLLIDVHAPTRMTAIDCPRGVAGGSKYA